MATPLVLIVDDSESTLLSLDVILQRHGYRVISAACGPDALELAVRHRPALIVLDINLPDINGREVCRRIKADPRTAS